MNIKKIKLKNFRCFKDKVFTFDSPFIVIEGKNGSGKTSLLEALYYACYLRSFRTRSGKELVNFENKHFFIQIDGTNLEEEAQSIQVGFADNTKIVKLNQKNVSSFKELIPHFRVIIAAEDDLELVKGSPEIRRNFLDQALIVESDDYLINLKGYKQILSNRNSLLFKIQGKSAYPIEDIKIWTEQIWNMTQKIQQLRISYLNKLEKQINSLIEENFNSEKILISLLYKSKVSIKESFEDFWSNYTLKLLQDELRQGRSLLGAHLDDFTINFRTKQAKVFASRGQQKLIVFLARIAQLKILRDRGEQALLLFDDFLTDLDDGIFKKCVEILTNLDCQVVLTSPLSSYITSKKIPNLKPKVIRI
ncbi:DNA replication and repair protein RecF [Candidatus Babeliales bacterium]|nr:DNA replication and repair protein RecF [Candidatus Babeliales bacterium]